MGRSNHLIIKRSAWQAAHIVAKEKTSRTRYNRKALEVNKSTEGNEHKGIPTYAGVGIVIGAALGMIFGLILFEELALGSAIGAAIGLVFGAGIGAHNKRKARE